MFVAAKDSHQPDLLPERSQSFVSHNEKDNYVPRGKAAALQAMSFVSFLVALFIEKGAEGHGSFLIPQKHSK